MVQTLDSLKTHRGDSYAQLPMIPVGRCPACGGYVIKEERKCINCGRDPNPPKPLSYLKNNNKSHNNLW